MFRNNRVQFAEFRSMKPTRFDQFNRVEPELCVTLRLLYVNVSRFVTFAAEEEKPKAADPKNFWHVQVSESLKRQALQTKFV